MDRIKGLKNFGPDLGRLEKRDIHTWKGQWQTLCGCLVESGSDNLMSHTTFQPFICELHQIQIERRYGEIDTYFKETKFDLSEEPQ